MESKFKKSSKWILAALIPFMAACGNQGNQVNSDLAIPVSVSDVVKKPIIQYISTTGTATAARAKRFVSPQGARLSTW